MDHKTYWEEIDGKWKQVEGEAKKKWEALTDNGLMPIDGNRGILKGKIQGQFDIPKEDVIKQFEEWAAKLKG